MAAKTITLGVSELEVSSVCLGTMTFGTAACPEETAVAILDRYVELGGNFIDTSEVYPVPLDVATWPETVGNGEEIIGRWLAARPEVREKVVIATKVTPSPVAELAKAKASREKALTGEFDDGGDPACDFSREQIRRACEASQKRLGVSCIDVYQLHWPERPTYNVAGGEVQYKPDGVVGRGSVAPDEQATRQATQGFDAIATTMGELIAEGKIKSWGLCNETPYGVCTHHSTCQRLGVAPPVSIQNGFSLTYRQFEGDLAEACAPHHCNLSLLAYGVLNGGVLSGKYLPGGDALPTSRYNVETYVLQPHYKSDAANIAVEQYAALAKQHGLAPADLASAWAHSRWFAGAVIIGATSVAQLEANWKASTIKLSDEVLQQIEAVHMKRRNPNCVD